MTDPQRLDTEETLTEFWAEIAEQSLDWIRPWSKTCSGSLKEGKIQWFEGGLLNASANCLDRHLPHKAKQRALVWEGDREGEQKIFSFAQLHAEVCQMANVLKELNIRKGDVVAIYLPMIPEAAISMLACARIGAVHTVIFAGFSAHALKQRLEALPCKCLITADSMQRGGKTLDLKAQVDEACAALDLPILLVQRDKSSLTLNAKKEFWWHELKQKASPFCDPEPMDAEDPLFILYTSGSTGQPKGLVHTHGGYLVQTAYTYQLIFDGKETDLFWCTADVGWITGHSYVLYGPLCNGVSTLMFEGIPTWPDAGRYWRIIDKYQVQIFYTAPTAIRALMRLGDAWLDSSSRQSLRLLGSVGEPINPEAWLWFKNKVGLGHCSLVDTWWQTETGSIMISPREESPCSKPGSAGKPIPGLVAVLLDEEGNELLANEAEGRLAFKYPWPSMARTIAGDHARYCKTYLAEGYYLTGDGAKRDEDGDYWITGRYDDVINVSGHRLGTAEIEGALVSHAAVAEAAVVGLPDDLKGQSIYAFVSLKQGFEGQPALQKELIEQVKKEISPIAKPDAIQFVSDLPKTRSGKIMRRLLRQIAGREAVNRADLGDLSTLANPDSLSKLIDSKHT